MVQKTEWTLASTDGRNRLHAITWRPDGPVRAIVILSHGMVEYIDRYDGFARYACGRGLLVSGHDHLGHGQSVASEADLGYFAPEKGFDCLIEDIHRHREHVAAQHPGVPVFVLGHSMGSFVIRNYIRRHADGLAGAVIMGTGNQPRIAARMGRLISGFLMKIKGPRYRSAFVNSLALGGLNKAFKPARTPNDFISRDTAVVDAYCRDPLCSFMFTVSAYHDMFGGMLALSDKDRLQAMPRTLPILLASGEQDPLGGMGKGIRELCRSYQRLGMQDVTLRLYPQDRHEILNELDRDAVYADVYAWLESKLKPSIDAAAGPQPIA